MQSDLHTIRLRRPWLRTVNDEPSGLRVDVPDTLPIDLPGIKSDEETMVTYTRRFHQPSGLSQSQPVWLWVESFSGGSLRILLNDEVLAEDVTTMPFRELISSRLVPSNRLTIQIAASNRSAGRIDGSVELQIGQSAQ